MFPWKEPEYKIITIEKDLISLVEEIKQTLDKNEPIVIDCETTGPYAESGLDYYNGWILSIAICMNIDKGYYIPITHTKDRIVRKNQLFLKTIIKHINPIISNRGLYIGHNIKFDYKFLWQAGIKLYPNFWDTSIAIQLLNGDTFKTRALKKVISNYVDIPSTKIKPFEDVAQGNLAEIAPEIACEYAINDVIFTYYLYMAIKPKIDNIYEKLFYKAEIPLIPILANMELKGLQIDVDYYKKIRNPLIKYRNQIETFIYNKYNINVASTQQVGKLFNENFSNLELKKSDKGNIVTDVSTLGDIIKKFPKHTEVHKLAKRILKFRNVEKALSTYIDKFPTICEQHYGNNGNPIYIMHTDFDQIKNSGRLSSKPNIQNIPRDVVVDIRKGFISRKGYVFVEADWASAELRLTAIASQEPKMLEAYIKNPKDADLHELTAKGVFEKNNITEDERHIGKTLNFSIIYGATEWSVSTTLGCSLEQAKIYIRNFYKTYKGIKKWKVELENFIQKNGYSETFYGRRRYMSDNVHPLMQQRWKYKSSIRQLVNHVIQGTCADLLKFAMVNIVKQLAKKEIDAYLVSTTHDSITLEVRNPDEVIPIIKNIMEINIQNILMPVDIMVKESFSKK